MPVTFTRLARDLVDISGSDQRSFLQGLISQDVEKVTVDRSVYGTLLTPQGKYLHDFIIAARDSHLLFDAEPGRSEDLVARLSRFKLRADISFEPRPDLAVFALFGVGAADLLSLNPNPGATAPIGDITAMVDPRSAPLGVRLVGPLESLQNLLTGLAATETNFDAYDQLRISLQVPDGSRDLDIEKSILLESNIDLLNGIDWEKGCYMGQELTARTKYRGLVKRSLLAFQADGNSAKSGDDVLSGDKVVGEVRSTNGDCFLASVRIDALDETGSALRVGNTKIQLLSPESIRSNMD
jgi:folate-binding protein YgfZ